MFSYRDTYPASHWMPMPALPTREMEEDCEQTEM